jgi:hypothetical protein
MAVKYVLIFILSSANPTEQHVAQTWSKLFPSYDDCLRQAATLEMQNAVLKDCRLSRFPVMDHRKRTLCSHRKPACLRSPTKPMRPHSRCRMSSQVEPGFRSVVSWARMAVVRRPVGRYAS